MYVHACVYVKGERKEEDGEMEKEGQRYRDRFPMLKQRFRFFKEFGHSPSLSTSPAHRSFSVSLASPMGSFWE